MSKISLPYQIANDTPADAGPVQSNYSRIEQHINTELIERGGTVAMTGQLRLVGNPVNSLDAAPKQYVDTLIPIGGVMLFGGVTAPAGGSWLVCDGSPYATADYPALFAVIATRFGGSGGFFNVPNLADRVPMGASASRAVGVTGGSADAIVVSHDHDYSHGHGASSGLVSSDHVHGISLMSGAADRALGTSANGAHAHAINYVEYNTGAPTAYLAFTGPGGLQVTTNSTTAGVGDHSHAVTDHLHAINGSTGGISANHNHAITVNGFGGRTQVVGAAATNANLQPYVVMAYLIRAA